MLVRLKELNDGNNSFLINDDKEQMLPDDCYILSMIEDDEILNSMEYDILTTTDKEYKSMVANSIIEMIITREHIKLILRFYNKYVAPMLNQLNDNKKIIYNLDSNDDDIKQVSLKVKDVMLCYLMCCYMETRKYQDIKENEIPPFVIYTMASFFDIDERIGKGIHKGLFNKL